MDYVLRKATLEDRPALARLIVESARGLSREDYSDEQIEAAIETVFGVDSLLILDGTYFVVELDGKLVGCEGWSKRRTLFGGDQYRQRESDMLEPAGNRRRFEPSLSTHVGRAGGSAGRS